LASTGGAVAIGSEAYHAGLIAKDHRHSQRDHPYTRFIHRSFSDDQRKSCFMAESEASSVELEEDEDEEEELV
jgi:hypothetical protein